MQQITTVYPIPQEMTLSGDHVSLASAVIVVPRDDAAARFAADLLGRWMAEEFLVNLPIVESAPPGATPIIIMSDAGALRLDVPAQAEGYMISAGADGVVLAGRDRQGTLYAVATLIQLIARREKDDGSGGGLCVPAGTIRDWPYRPIRYVHVYVPGRRHIPFFKRYVRDFLLRYKFNGMILEVGGGVRLTRRPEIATGWKRTVIELYAHGEQVPITGESSPLGPDKRFQDSTHHGIGDDGFIEPDELRECVAFARDHGQEVVPEIQALSHVYYLACAHREIAEIPDALFPDAYCPSNERTYEILFDVMDEYVQIMGSRTVHIGHDEWRAGGVCPRCRTQHPGDLLARDVIRIYEHLKARGVNVWMWGDHFASGHNETGHSHGREGKVWYDYPSTTGAWEKVRAACPDLVLTNWSWSLKRSDRPDDVWNRGRTWDVQGECDQELHEKGFKFLYGNFDGELFERWPERSARYDVLGGEISSWCTMEEFQIGKMHVPRALASINLLWSNHYPPRDEAARQVMHLLPDVSQRMKAILPPRIRLVPERQATVDLSPYFTAPLKSDRWDLSELRGGTFEAGGLRCGLGDGAVVVRRAHQAESPLPAQVTIPLNDRFARLVFLQTSVGKARRPKHAGDGTFFPNESSELIGVYEVAFHDGLVLPVEIRAKENVGAWDAGIDGILYHARNIEAGTLPGGGPLLIWGNEWSNPRPDEPITEIRFRGAAGASDAQPILLGITTIEKDRLSDYRR